MQAAKFRYLEWTRLLPAGRWNLGELGLARRILGARSLALGLVPLACGGLLPLPRAPLLPASTDMVVDHGYQHPVIYEPRAASETIGDPPVLPVDFRALGSGANWERANPIERYRHDAVFEAKGDIACITYRGSQCWTEAVNHGTVKYRRIGAAHTGIYNRTVPTVDIKGDPLIETDIRAGRTHNERE